MHIAHQITNQASHGYQVLSTHRPRKLDVVQTAKRFQSQIALSIICQKRQARHLAYLLIFYHNHDQDPTGFLRVKLQGLLNYLS